MKFKARLSWVGGAMPMIALRAVKSKAAEMAVQPIGYTAMAAHAQARMSACAGVSHCTDTSATSHRPSLPKSKHVKASNAFTLRMGYQRNMSCNTNGNDQYRPSRACKRLTVHPTTQSKQVSNSGAKNHARSWYAYECHPMHSNGVDTSKPNDTTIRIVFRNSSADSGRTTR
jgi:hypothetical protein